MENMEYFPWMESVYQAFSRTFPAEYSSESLKLLNKHLEEENNKTMNTNVDSLKKFYACLRDLYNHFCWKIDWHKESQAMKSCCVKILSYLIKTGILVSKGKPTSKWINQVLAAMRIFPGEFDLLCDALLLVQKLKKTYYTIFAIILRHFLYTNQMKIEDPSTYFKTLMLIRRLKFLTKDKYEKSELISFAVRTQRPTNSFSWLISQRIPHLPKINNKNLTKILLSKKLSPKVFKYLRDILLSGMYFESHVENAIPKESFIIDSEMLSENDRTSNAAKKKKNKRTKKCSLKNASQSLTDELFDFECNNFIPNKKFRNSPEFLSQELSLECDNSISTGMVQTIKSSDGACSSFTNKRSTLKDRRKKRKSTKKTENNNLSEHALMNEDNNENTYEMQVSPRKYKKLTNRKSESIEMCEENEKLNNSDICPEQLFMIDNEPSINSENTKVQSNNVLYSQGNLEKYSRENSPECDHQCVSADLTLVSPNKSKDNFLNQNESEFNVSKTENYGKITSKEVLVSSKVNSPKDRTLNTLSSCDSEIINGSLKLERISEEEPLIKSNVLNEKDHLNDSFPSLTNSPLQFKLQSSTKTVLSSSASLNSPERCREKFSSYINSIENFKSEEDKLLHSDMENNLMGTNECILKNLLNDICEKISCQHENFNRSINFNNMEKLHTVDLHENLFDSAACDQMNSTEMEICNIKVVKPCEISLSNSKFVDASNETQNSPETANELNENSNLYSKEENLSYTKHSLSETSLTIDDDNTLNEKVITHSESNIGNTEGNQLFNQLSLGDSEIIRNDEKFSTELLDNYIKKVLNKMVDKVANKMDNAVETSSFETLKEKMLKEGFTPLKFSPICKISHTFSNYNADNLKTEGLSPDKIKNCLSFSDVFSEHLKDSKNLETVSPNTLNESTNKDFCIYRDILHDLKEDMSDGVSSCSTSPEKESQKDYQDGHSCSDSETDLIDDIISSEQCSDINDMENNHTLFLPATEKNDSQHIQSSDQDASISEKCSSNETKISEVKNQFYKVPESSPQSISSVKTLLPEEIERLTASQFTPVVNLGRRCDDEDTVMNKIKVEETNCLAFEKTENRSSVHKAIENTSFKNIEKKVMSSEVNENKQAYSEEIIDDATLKGLFEHETWEEVYSQSENIKLEKGSKKFQSISNFTESDTSEADLSQKEIITTVPVSETVDKELSIKSSVEMTENDMQLESKEPFVDISLKNKSMISCDSRTLGEPNFELPIEIKEVCIQLNPAEVTKNLESKANENSPELFRMRLRKRQTSNCLTDTLMNETISTIPNSEVLESSKSPNETRELSEELESKQVTENILVPNTSEGSVAPYMKLRKRQTSKSQVNFPVDETILLIPTSKSSENEQNVRSPIHRKKLSVHLDPNQDIKDLVSKTCEEPHKSIDMHLRKEIMKDNEKEALYETPKSKNRMSLRSSKRLKSQSSNLGLSADLSQLCLDSPSSKRYSKFKPFGEHKNVEEANQFLNSISKNQSLESKKLNNISSEDTVLAHNSDVDSKPQNGYNLRTRKSIIMPGKLKF